MAKRGQTRRITQIIQGMDPLIHVAQYTLRLEFPDYPRVQYLFTKSEHPDFLGLLDTDVGLILRGKDDGKDYYLSWDECDLAHIQELMRRIHLTTKERFANFAEELYNAANSVRPDGRTVPKGPAFP